MVRNVHTGQGDYTHQGFIVIFHWGGVAIIKWLSLETQKFCQEFLFWGERFDIQGNISPWLLLGKFSQRGGISPRSPPPPPKLCTQVRTYVRTQVREITHTGGRYRYKRWRDHLQVGFRWTWWSSGFKGAYTRLWFWWLFIINLRR